jgi:hypothetical protein
VTIGGQSWRGAYIALYRRAPKEHYLAVCRDESACSNLSTSKSWLGCEDAGHDAVGGALTSFLAPSDTNMSERPGAWRNERPTDRVGRGRTGRDQVEERPSSRSSYLRHAVLRKPKAYQDTQRKRSPEASLGQSGVAGPHIVCGWTGTARPGCWPVGSAGLLKTWRLTTLERYFQRPHFPCSRSSRINSASTAS